MRQHLGPTRALFAFLFLLVAALAACTSGQQGNSASTPGATATVSRQPSSSPTTSGGASPVITAVEDWPLATTALSPGTRYSVTATCPGGALALSGGWHTPIYPPALPSSGPPPPAPLSILASQRSGQSGWTVAFSPTAPMSVAAGEGMVALVQCLRQVVQGATIAEVAKTLALSTTPTSASVAATATCPAGSARVGGGFQVSDARVQPRTLAPSLAQNWLVAVAHPALPAGQSVTAYAECLTFSGVRNVEVRGFDTVPHTELHNGAVTVDVKSTCPTGEYVSGGGFKIDAGWTTGLTYIRTNGVVDARLIHPTALNTWAMQLVTTESNAAPDVFIDGICLVL